ncbi:Proteinase inhibitor I13, potato inhibitor I [Dillenia turbinata]|uniref:Proteinase inhibitor I13, potato inhibitor I n=1 Tax=Dillenia turbinata TaxID=194707 RepID=A0AAN8W8H2_9MAGN
MEMKSGQKRTWPELVGVKAEEAERKIKEEMPAVTQFQVAAQNSFVTMEYNPRRIRLFVDDIGNAFQPPRIG